MCLWRLIEFIFGKQTQDKQCELFEKLDYKTYNEKVSQLHSEKYSKKAGAAET